MSHMPVPAWGDGWPDAVSRAGQDRAANHDALPVLWGAATVGTSTTACGADATVLY